MTMKTVLLAACCAASVAGPAMAETLDIRNFAGRVEIRTGDVAGIQVDVTPGGAGASPTVARVAGGVTVTGDYERDWEAWEHGRGGQDCRGDGADREIRFARGGRYHRFSDLPLIRVTAPRGLDLRMDEVVVDGSAGEIGSADLALAGCARLDIAAVSGTFDGRLAGVSELSVGAVGGDMTLEFAGAGALDVGDIAGALDADIAGAGEFRIGAVRGGADLDVAGAGQIDIAYVAGALDVDMAGAGDLNIEGGDVDLISVDVVGIGDVRYGGAARLARVGVFGFGEVDIADADDVDVTSGGFGAVRVNGRRAR